MNAEQLAMPRLACQFKNRQRGLRGKSLATGFRDESVSELEPLLSSQFKIVNADIPDGHARHCFNDGLFTERNVCG